MEFFRLYSRAPAIVRADKSADGTLPARAFQYCEPVASASAMGWYVYPPVGFSLMWTGSAVLFLLNDDTEWAQLDRFFLNDAVEEYLRYAPEDLHDCYPSFLDVFKDGNIVQIWTGYAVRTQPGYCHQVRSPINLPQSGLFQTFEGLIDSSWHVGPLLTNIRILKQDEPIHFPTHRPLAQVVPLPVEVLRQQPTDTHVVSIPETEGDFWRSWRSTYDGRNSSRRGSYAVQQRRKNAEYSKFSSSS